MVLTHQHITEAEREPQVYIGYVNGRQVQFFIRWNEETQDYEQVVLNGKRVQDSVPVQEK